MDTLVLTAWQRRGLQRQLQQTRDAHVFRRTLAVLEFSRGRPIVAIARTLATHHEAEDAFQATFLVLLRRAASIRSRELLANWLYGVAHKTARKARQMAAKRGSRE